MGAFDYIKYPKRLNLGCGFDIRNGYLNIDFQEYHKPDLVADITCLDMLPSGYYSEILAQDVLEHIRRDATSRVLDEWSRLLEIGGILFLRVPDIVGVAALLKKRHFPEDQRELVQCLFGTQAYTGDYHYTGFTKELICDYLKKAGFRVLDIHQKDEWLLEVLSEKHSPQKYVLGTRLCFSKNEDQAADYEIYGFSKSEDGFTWTDGYECCMILDTRSDLGKNNKNQGELILEIEHVFLSRQEIQIYVCDQCIFQGFVKNRNKKTLCFNYPEDGIVEIKMRFPQAASPFETNGNDDRRVLGIGIRSLTIKEV